jgi:hypothetical protein
MKHLLALALVSSSLVATGCIDEGADSDDVETSTTVEALATPVTMNWYQCSGYNCTYYISNYNTETCFLSGMAGSMTVAAGWTAGASVTPNPSTNQWRVQMYGTTPRALVTCIRATANRVTNVTWRTGDPTWGIAPGPNPTRRHCFAGSITATTSFNHAPAYLQVRRMFDNTHAVYGTNLDGRQAQITATCVDVINEGNWYYGNSGSSTYSQPTAHNPWGTRTVACGLDGLGGIFNSSGDAWYVGYNTSTDDYTFVSTPGTQGGVRCVR